MVIVPGDDWCCFQFFHCRKKYVTRNTRKESIICCGVSKLVLMDPPHYDSRHQEGLHWKQFGLAREVRGRSWTCPLRPHGKTSGPYRSLGGDRCHWCSWASQAIAVLETWPEASIQILSIFIMKVGRNLAGYWYLISCCLNCKHKELGLTGRCLSSLERLLRVEIPV